MLFALLQGLVLIKLHYHLKISILQKRWEGISKNSADKILIGPYFIPLIGIAIFISVFIIEIEENKNEPLPAKRIWNTLKKSVSPFKRVSIFVKKFYEKWILWGIPEKKRDLIDWVEK